MDTTAALGTRYQEDRSLFQLPAGCLFLSACRSHSRQVCAFTEGEEVGHDITAFQRYGLGEFEAYRQLGYLMGWAYLANVQFNNVELTPTKPCEML